MRPSILCAIVMAIAFCFFSCDSEDAAPVPELLELVSVSAITSNSATAGVRFALPAIDQNDTTFIVNGYNVDRIGIAYSTDPNARRSFWDTVTTVPTVSPVIPVEIRGLQSNTTYYVQTYVRFRAPYEDRTKPMAVLISKYGVEQFEFVTK